MRAAPAGGAERRGRDRNRGVGRRHRPADPDVRNLRWSVVGELVFGIAVLVITAMLVNAQPARGALALPYSTEFREPTMLIDLLISPAKAGPVDFHIYTLSPSGGNLFTPGVTAEMSIPSKGIAPLDVPARARRAQPLHRVRGAGHAGRRHGHVREQVLDPVLGQVADRDPRACATSSTRSRCRRR